MAIRTAENTSRSKPLQPATSALGNIGVSAVLDAISDPILVVEAQGRVVAANSAARAFLTAAPAPLLEDIVEESAQHVRAFLSLASVSTSPVPARLSLREEGQWKRAVGNLLGPSTPEAPALLMVRWQASPKSRVFADLDQRIQALHTEIREWRAIHAERSQLLREVEEASALYQHQVELLETVTGNISTALFLLDERGRPRFLNPAATRLFGYSLEDVADRHLHYAVHSTLPDGEPFPIDDCPLARALPSRTLVGPYEDTFIANDGSRVPVLTQAAPIRRGSDFVGTVIEARDISEIKAREEQITRLNQQLHQTVEELQRASAAKDEFLGLVSHELKNPLTTVFGIARHLEHQHEGMDRGTLAESLAMLSHDASRLAEIIENMLVLSRAEVRPPEMEPILPARIATKVVAEFGRRRHQRDVRLQIDDEQSMVLGHSGWIEQVVANLLSNADKYSDAREPIDVLVQAHGSHVEIRVLDKGPGIAAEARDKLFEPFTRGLSIESGIHGLGLGLSVCQRLATLMDGDVEVRPRTDVSGTEATLRLPVLGE